jgi:hypothetical protein
MNGTLQSIRVYRHVRRTLERLPLPLFPSVREVHIARDDLTFYDAAPALAAGVNVFARQLTFNNRYAHVTSRCAANICANSVKIQLNVGNGNERVLMDMLVHFL